MKLKDLSFIFITGVLAIAFVIVSLISKLLIEHGGLLIIGGVLLGAFLIKLICGIILQAPVTVL